MSGSPLLTLKKTQDRDFCFESAILNLPDVYIILEFGDQYFPGGPLPSALQPIRSKQQGKRKSIDVKDITSSFPESW